MWAIVKDGVVVKTTRGNKGISLDGVQYPPDIFTKWDVSELKAIDIFPVIEKTVSRNPELYKEGAVVTTITEDAVEKQHSKVAKDIDAVKDTMITKIKTSAYSMLSQTDWYVIRALELTPKVIPTNIQNFRTAIRAAVDTMETAILDAITIEDLEGLMHTYDVEGVENGVLYKWPDRDDYP